MSDFASMASSVGSSSGAPRSGNNTNLFVAALSNDVTDEMLFAAFSPFGKILTCKVMLDIHTGVSRGFGFVLFENAEDAARALTSRQGSQLGQKRIHVSVANTNGFSGLQQTPKMYVRNVPKALSLEFLRTFFLQFGDIVRINFRDDQTQINAPPEHRAYLATTTIIFLEYKTSEQAEAAVKATHNSRPWPELNMVVPLLSKPAETSQMRNERRARQSSKSAGQSTGSQPRASSSTGSAVLEGSAGTSVSEPGSFTSPSGPTNAIQLAPPLSPPLAMPVPQATAQQLPTVFYAMPMPNQPGMNLAPQGLTLNQLQWPLQSYVMIPQGAPMMIPSQGAPPFQGVFMHPLNP